MPGLSKPPIGPILRPLSGGAAYPFPNGQPRDYSGNGVHGTISGGVTRAGGQFGYCPDFNGSTGFIDLGTAPTLNPGLRDMTVACWINVRNTAGQQWRAAQKRGTGGNGTVAGWRINGGSNALGGSAVPWNLSATQMDAGDGSFARMSTTDYALPAGWHSIVVTWRNQTGEFLLYLDGVYRETANVVGTVAGKSITNTRNATLGAAWNPGPTISQYLNGQMDAVMIEFRAWSATQVRDYHRDPFAAFRRRENVALYVQPAAASTKPFFFQRHILRNRRAG